MCLLGFRIYWPHVYMCRGGTVVGPKLLSCYLLQILSTADGLRSTKLWMVRGYREIEIDTLKLSAESDVII